MADTEDNNYSTPSSFDKKTFLEEFSKQFKGNPRFGGPAAENVLAMLRRIERDPDITDVREIAYLLATTAWETTVLQTVERPATNKKTGKPIPDKNKQPIKVKMRKWVAAMAPVDEVGHGKGRQYHEPVKVKKMPDGTVRVTEQDGDQFIIKMDGSFRRLKKGAEMGSTDGGPVSAVYEADDGDEQVYFGRGYVQLTWWSNYARAGVELGMGLDLLLDPEKVKSPEVAYKIMSYGMRTGKIFANGHSFKKYFKPKTTDYVGARHMVNGKDHAKDIAEIANKFEAVLRTSYSSAPITLSSPFILGKP
jgi:hypothetical protein